MKRWLLGMSVVAAMLLAASSASAAGVNLAWSRCFGETGALANKTFACTSNTAPANLLVCSFVLPSDLLQVSGNEVVIDVLTQLDPLSPWWDLKNPGACRQLALGINFTANAGDVVCADWAAGQSSGGIGAYSNELGSISPALDTHHRRMKIAIAVPLAGLADLLANTDYFACNVSVSNIKTVGTGACAGCTDPVCIVLNSIKVTTGTPANDVTIGNATTPGSNIVTWQGNGPSCTSVPTKNVTWGTVKSLYH